MKQDISEPVELVPEGEEVLRGAIVTASRGQRLLKEPPGKPPLSPGRAPPSREREPEGGVKGKLEAKIRSQAEKIIGLKEEVIKGEKEREALKQEVNRLKQELERRGAMEGAGGGIGTLGGPGFQEGLKAQKEQMKMKQNFGDEGEEKKQLREQVSKMQNQIKKLQDTLRESVSANEDLVIFKAIADKRFTETSVAHQKDKTVVNSIEQQR